MKKRTKFILIFLAIVLSGLGLYFYIDLHNYYGSGGIDKFELNTGDSFTIKLSTNGSTGFQNCWVNENKCHSVERISEEYESNWPQRDGSGGTAAWTFRATAKGIDTIKISKCSTGGMQKDCSFFAGDSLRLEARRDSIVSRYAPYRQTDYTFIVIVD